MWKDRDAAVGGSVRIGPLCGQMFPVRSRGSAEVVTSVFILLTLSPLSLSACYLCSAECTALGAQGGDHTLVSSR